MAAIYILEPTALKRASLDGARLTTLISSRLTSAKSLDVTAEHIYIGDIASRRRRVARWNLPRGGGFRNLISGVEPHALAVTAQHVYILEPSTLKRASLDGSGLTTLISSGLSLARDLAVTAQHIYILESAALQRASLDGTGLTTLISSGLSRALALAVTAQHVYILESAALQRASLDGTGLTTLISSGLSTTAWGLAVTAQHIYILESAALQRASLDGTGLTTLISSGLTGAWALEAVVDILPVARAGVPRTRADPFDAIASAGLPRARARAVVLQKHEAYARAGIPAARAAGTIVLPELPPGRWDGLYSPPAMRALVDGVVRALDAEPRAQPLWGEVDPSVLPHLAWYWAAIAYDIEGGVDQQRAAVDAAKRLTVEIGTEAALATAGAINRATVTLRYLAETHEGTPWPRRKDVSVVVRAPLDVEIVDLYREYWTRLAEACLPHTLQLRGVDVSY